MVHELHFFNYTMRCTLSNDKMSPMLLFVHRVGNMIADSVASNNYEVIQEVSMVPDSTVCASQTKLSTVSKLRRR